MENVSNDLPWLPVLEFLRITADNIHEDFWDTELSLKEFEGFWKPPDQRSAGKVLLQGKSGVMLNKADEQQLPQGLSAARDAYLSFSLLIGT